MGGSIKDLHLASFLTQSRITYLRNDVTQSGLGPSTSIDNQDGPWIYMNTGQSYLVNPLILDALFR